MGYTLYTNSDFDALVSALILKDEITIDTIIFVDPSDVTAGNIKHTDSSLAVAANIPPVPGVSLWFDHHRSNVERDAEFEGKCEIAPSCARVIENYYGRNNYPTLLEAADKIDTANFSRDDLLNPPAFDLISLTISGNIHNPEAMEYNRHLLTLLEDTPEKALADALVQKRMTSYKHDLAMVKTYIENHIELVGNVAVVDLREAPTQTILESSFKFLHYAAMPEATVAIRIYHPNLDTSLVRFQVGRSILNPRPSQVDIASILKPLGGGGHAAAGGCTVSVDNFEQTFTTILSGLQDKS